jgi:hypothetical protein
LKCALYSAGAFGDNLNRDDAHKIELEGRLLGEAREVARLEGAEAGRVLGRKYGPIYGPINCPINGCAVMNGRHAPRIHSEGGRATMNGPHAAAIHSAGGRASDSRPGGRAAGKARLANASWAGVPTASLSQTEAKKMVDCCYRRKVRAYEANAKKGVKHQVADARDAVARGWRL